MIYHVPEVYEKLQSLGITVMVEMSSYEKNPLGRLEWIKLYGVLYGKLDTANEIFNDQVERVNTISEYENTDKTVAVFSITPNGTVNVRVPGDYISTMIEIAGGNYVPENLGTEDGSKMSTLSITMEDFYMAASDADILIYNGTIQGDVLNIDELTDKAALLSEFKAIREGNIYCLSEDYFQQTTHVADFIEDVHSILTLDAASLNYLYKLED